MNERHNLYYLKTNGCSAVNQGVKSKRLQLDIDGLFPQQFFFWLDGHDSFMRNWFCFQSCHSPRLHYTIRTSHIKHQIFESLSVQHLRLLKMFLRNKPFVALYLFLKNPIQCNFTLCISHPFGVLVCRFGYNKSLINKIGKHKAGTIVSNNDPDNYSSHKQNSKF